MESSLIDDKEFANLLEKHQEQVRVYLKKMKDENLISLKTKERTEGVAGVDRGARSALITTVNAMRKQFSIETLLEWKVNFIPILGGYIHDKRRDIYKSLILNKSRFPKVEGWLLFPIRNQT